MLLNPQHERIECALLGKAAARERARHVAPAGAASEPIGGVRLDELQGARRGWPRRLCGALGTRAGRRPARRVVLQVSGSEVAERGGARRGRRPA